MLVGSIWLLRKWMNREGVGTHQRHMDPMVSSQHFLVLSAVQVLVKQLRQGTSWRRDGDLGTASSLAVRCNKGGTEDVNHLMRCRRRTQVPTLRTMSLFLVMKPGTREGLRGRQKRL